MVVLPTSEPTARPSRLGWILGDTSKPVAVVFECELSTQFYPIFRWLIKIYKLYKPPKKTWVVEIHCVTKHES